MLQVSGSAGHPPSVSVLTIPTALLRPMSRQCPRLRKKTVTSGIGIGFVMQSLLFTANGFVRRLAPNGIRASQNGGHLLDWREENFSPGREAVTTIEKGVFAPNCVFIPAA